MKPHVSAITLGVEDVDRAKQFYSEGLGWPIRQAQGPWASFSLGDGSSALDLFPRDMLAKDAGLDAGGDGFAGITLSYVIRDEDRVAEILAGAEAAGATIVKAAERAPWGGTTGYFADPDGYLWKVAANGGDQPFLAE